MTTLTDFIAQRTPAQRRALAIALAVLALLLALAVLLLPVYAMHKRYDDALASIDDRLVRYRRIAAQAPEYRKALDALRAKDGRRFFLKNTAPNLAGVELQELVRAAVEGNGGRISTSQNQPPRDESGYKQFVVTFQFFATTPNLQKILYAIETQQPYMTVDAVTLRPMNAFRGFRPGPGQEPEINVQLDVAAFGFPAAPEKPAAPAKGGRA
jgi:hypothetical protein